MNSIASLLSHALTAVTVSTAAVLATSHATAATPPDYTEYGRLLATYVEPTGVDYAAWAANEGDVNALDRVLETFAGVNAEGLEPDARMAFYINLYNAGMLQAVFEAYPIDSVTTFLPDFGIFKKPFILQGGRKLSLDAVEKGILLADYPDEPRIHFAVNCASRSCPPLRDEPYTAAKLEAQLEAQTRQFLNSEHGVRLALRERKVYVSALFNWYADDFPGDSPLAYIQPYYEGRLPRRLEVAFMDYDWSLNTPQG